MAYKDLLVHLDDGRGCAGRIEAAIGLAAAHGAHLTGFYPIVEIPLISYIRPQIPPEVRASMDAEAQALADAALDRKSTRLNSSHVKISYAVFCLKKKKNNKQ